MACVIYALVDPITRETRYVGKTDRPLTTRLRGHIDCARRTTRPPVRAWIRGLLNKGLRPEILVIEYVDDRDWREVEKSKIAQFQANGLSLLNSTAGGDGLIGYKHSVETRAKIGNLSKGKKRPQHVVDAVVAAHTGAKRSIEARGKMGSAWTADRITAHIDRCKKRVMSDMQRLSISLANSGRKHAPEVIEKRVAKLRGRKQTADQKARSGAGVALAWTTERRLAQASRMRALRAAR